MRRCEGELARGVSSPERGAPARRTRVENLFHSSWVARESRPGFDTVAETSEFPDHLGQHVVGPAALMTAGPRSSDVNTFVQNLPDETAEPMGNGADGLRVSKANDQPTVHQLKDTAFGLHRSVGGLVEQAAHLTITFRGSMTSYPPPRFPHRLDMSRPTTRGAWRAVTSYRRSGRLRQ